MLVGIAKLAAESERLESKRQVEYFELPARSILNRTKPGMPFEWAINPYRGCEFGCRYCYARYTHEFMELDASEFEDFENGAGASKAALGRLIGIGCRADGDRLRRRHFAQISPQQFRGMRLGVDLVFEFAGDRKSVV